MKKLLLLIGIFILFFLVLPARAFEISPIKMLLTADPGTSQTVILKIKNSQKTDSDFLLNVFGLKQDNAGLPVFERGISAAESWVYPENNQVNIKAGETKSVNFIIKVPASTPSGSYYVGLAAEPFLLKQGQNSLNTRLVSLLTLQVSGLVSELILIEKWQIYPETITEKTWKFNLRLKNDGSVEVPMRGLMAIRNYKGEEIFSESIIVGNKLLAGSKRALEPEVILKDRIKIPGLYQAQVKLNYGKTNQEVSAITYIWYFPRWSKVALIPLVAIAGMVLVLLFKRKKNRVIKV